MSQYDRDIDSETAAAALGAGAGAGIIAGRESKIANHRKLWEAIAYEGRGMSPQDIWKVTGWFKGPDGQWKFEIPETGAKFKFQQGERLKPWKGTQANPRGWDIAGTPEAELTDAERPLGTRVTGKLSDFLEFPALFESYPGIDKMMTQQADLGPRTRGRLHPQEGLQVDFRASPMDASGTLMHEIQHAVQSMEGFGLGGSPGAMAGMFPIETEARGDYEAYRGLAGEVEARMVQDRVLDAMSGGYGEPTYDRFPLADPTARAFPASEQLIYGMPKRFLSEVAPQGPAMPQMQLGSLPIANQIEGSVPEEAAGSTARYLMSLLKRALK